MRVILIHPYKGSYGRRDIFTIKLVGGLWIACLSAAFLSHGLAVWLGHRGEDVCMARRQKEQVIYMYRTETVDYLGTGNGTTLHGGPGFPVRNEPGDRAVFNPQLCYDAGCMSGFTSDSCRDTEKAHISGLIEDCKITELGDTRPTGDREGHMLR